MNPLQKAAVRRKAFYLAAILALFTVSIFYRGLEARTPDGGSHVWLPFGRDDRQGATGAVGRGGDALARGTILSQARKLELRELELGEHSELSEVTGEGIRLALTGSRGVVVTYLWLNAIEQQKRNDFHKFERSVKAVTTLQPHFITPWIFQSWNIAYNVSVEMQSLGDMYFYIARGIELLAEGERRNKRSPDMRYQIAFYYQNKFGVSDQVQTLRCLFQLSCLPPNDWAPDALVEPADGAVNLEAFKKFCADNPVLVRRLRGEERLEKGKAYEGLRARTPAEVVQFLRDNRKVPTRYRNSTDLHPADRQFPVFPPQFNEGEGEYTPDRPTGPDASGYLAARAWFTYANVLVPPADRDDAGLPIPSGMPQPLPAPGGYDPFKYRVPRLPMLIIFKQGPARAQTYQAEMFQKDGWFDAGGWVVDRGAADAPWFPGQQVVVGAGEPWSQEEWRKSAARWRRHGEETGLILDEARRQRYQELVGLPPGARDDALGYPPDPTPDQRDDPAFMRRYKAHTALYFYHSNRNVTNFPYYLAATEAEQKPETVQARKTLWQADQARRLGQNVAAVQLYDEGIAQWKRVLLTNPSFHRSERLDRAEEETAEIELEYVRLLARTDPRVWEKAGEEYGKAYAKTAAVAAAVVPVAAALPAPTKVPLPLRDEQYAETAEKHFSPFREPMPNIPGDPRSGGPWVTDSVRHMVLDRQGVAHKPVPDAQPAAPAAPPGTQGP